MDPWIPWVRWRSNLPATQSSHIYFGPRAQQAFATPTTDNEPEPAPEVRGSTLAPCSLVSTVDRHPTGSTRFVPPAPPWSDVTLVSSQASSYASALHPFGFTGLPLPSGSTVCPSSPQHHMVFQAPGFSSVPQAVSSALALWTCVATLCLWLLCSAPGLHLSCKSPWFRPDSQQRLHLGFSFHWFRHGLFSSWLRSGSLPGSSLHEFHRWSSFRS